MEWSRAISWVKKRLHILNSPLWRNVLILHRPNEDAQSIGELSSWVTDLHGGLEVCVFPSVLSQIQDSRKQNPVKAM